MNFVRFLKKGALAAIVGAFMLAGCSTQTEQDVLSAVEAACIVLPTGAAITINILNSLTGQTTTITNVINGVASAICPSIETAVEDIINDINNAGGTATVTASTSTSTGVKHHYKAEFLPGGKVKVLSGNVPLPNGGIIPPAIVLPFGL